jgi:hypothetical protein
MCTYATLRTTLDGSAKGPSGSWFHVTDGTVYFSITRYTRWPSTR